MRYPKSLSALVLALSLSANAMTPFTAADIRIDGLQRVSSGSVFDALTIEPGDQVTDADISAATRALFDTGFFDQVEVTADEDVLVIKVTERPAVSRIEISGNSAIETDDLLINLRRSGIAEGDVLRRATLNQLEQAIQRQYTDRGRYDATVSTEIIEQDRNRVQLNITIFEGSIAKIRQIDIVGNQQIDDATLRNEMMSTTPGFFSWISGSGEYQAEQVLADVEAIRSYYLDRGFINVEVGQPKIELSESFDEVFVTISISEGQQYRVGEIAIGGAQPIDLSAEVQTLELQRGEIFSRQQVNSAVASMQRRLADAGYAEGRVQAVPEVDDASNTVDVTLVVTPGPLVYVRRIEFRGNTDTSDVVLRREIPQLEASVSSAREIERGRINLQRLGFFSSVRSSIRPVPGQPDQVDVVYEVVEQASGSLSASLGFNQGEGVLLAASVNQKNFLGTGNAVSFSLQSSSSVKEARFSFVDPYFTVDGVSRGIDLYFRETDFDELETADYTTDEIGLGLSFGYPVSNRARINSRFVLQEVSLKTNASAPQYIRDFLVSEGLPESSEEASFGELTLGLSYVYNTLNKAFLPTEGTRHRLAFDSSVPGSDLEYYLATYSGETFIPVWETEDVSLNFDTRLGYGEGFGDSENLPFLKNFFAGGIRSVRGYAFNSLGPTTQVDGLDKQIGGNILVTGSASLQFPMIGIEESEQARLALFTDLGQVYADEFDAAELRYSAGLALAWMTPIGPLSFTYAAALNADDEDETEGFQFSIGSSF